MEFNQLGSFGSFGCKVKAFISGLPPFFSDLIQSLIGTGDGSEIDDSLSIVSPQPTVQNVPVVASYATGEFIKKQLTLNWDNPAVQELDITMEFRHPIGGGFIPAVGGMFSIGTNTTLNWLNCWWVQGGTNDHFILYYDVEGSVQSVSSEAIPLDPWDGNWHTLRAIMTPTSLEIIFDGSSVASATGLTGIGNEFIYYFEFMSGGRGGLSGLVFNGRTRYTKIDAVVGVTPATLWESNCDDGRGPVLINKAEDTGTGIRTTGYAEIDGGSFADTNMWNVDDNTPSRVLRDGGQNLITTDGDVRAYGGRALTASDVHEITMLVYITGEANQRLCGQQQGYGIHMYANLNYLGTVRSLACTYYLGGSVTTLEGPLEIGWHEIKVTRPGSFYQFEIDGVAQANGGTSTGRFVNMGFRVGMAGGGTTGSPSPYQTKVRFFSYRTALGDLNTLVRNGKLVFEFEGDNYKDPVYQDGDISIMPLNAAGESLVGDGSLPDYTPGLVHNGAISIFNEFYGTPDSSVELIQNSVDIVDYVTVTNPTVFPGQKIICPRISTTRFKNEIGFDGEASGVVVATNLPSAGWYVLNGSGTPSQSLIDSPLPPTGAVYDEALGVVGYVVQHGYDGSFWADEDGEYAPRGFPAILAHTSGAENLLAVYVKNDPGQCGAEKLLQYSLGKQFVEAEIPELAAYQGASGCEGLITYAVATDGPGLPLRLSGGSLVIISQG